MPRGWAWSLPFLLGIRLWETSGEEAEMTTPILQTGKLRRSHLWHEAPPPESGTERNKESQRSEKEQCPQIPPGFRTRATLPPTLSSLFPGGQYVMPSKIWCWLPPAGDSRTCMDQSTQGFLPQDLSSRFSMRFSVARALEIKQQEPQT